jgi:hypothetical protein
MAVVLDQIYAAGCCEQLCGCLWIMSGLNGLMHQAGSLAWYQVTVLMKTGLESGLVPPEPVVLDN